MTAPEGPTLGRTTPEASTPATAGPQTAQTASPVESRIDGEPKPRRDDLNPDVDLFLVVEPGGGWAYATTDRDKALERRKWHGGVIGRVPVLLLPDDGHHTQRKPAQEAVQPRTARSGYAGDTPPGVGGSGSVGRPS